MTIPGLEVRRTLPIRNMEGLMMKLQLNPSIATQAIPDTAPAAKVPNAVAGPGDDIRISSAVAALDWSVKIHQVTASVQNGSYQVSSAATSNAIVEDALSGY
jgi:hypothetical protein